MIWSLAMRYSCLFFACSYSRLLYTERESEKLLASSRKYIFYAWNKPSFTIILLGSIVLNYFGALLVERAGQTGKKKLWLVLTVVCNLLILFYFKYFNFTIRTLKKIFDIHTQFANVLLPIGISFLHFKVYLMLWTYTGEMYLHRRMCLNLECI